MTELRSIILAAGKGVRMKSDIPKVLHCICNKPIIQHVYDLVSSLKIKKTYVVLGHKSEVVRKYLREDVGFIQQKQLLGTADAIKIASPYFQYFKGDVLILCGDVPLLSKETLTRLIRRHQTTKAPCTFLTSRVINPKGYGRVIRDSKGKVLCIREEKDVSLEEGLVNEINTGIYCFRAKDLFRFVSKVKKNKKKGEYYLTDVIAILAAEKLRIETVETQNVYEGLGINTREDLAFVEDVLRRKNVKYFMQQGVTIVDPETTFISSDVRIGRDTVIRPFTIIENDVEIGRRCLLGPFCHVRPGSRIGDDVSAGNYTEISRTAIGEGCFMQHFGFLGDAKIGKRVNIGAGVVTANFDGKNKNITQIEDDAFIGSDSILVAPLKIGRGAVTGAGSVVPRRKDVPNNTVVAGVPARILPRRKNK